MTKLDCTVTNCYYNKDKLCCLDSIKVEGTTAEVSEGTACASFRDSKKDTFYNSCTCNDRPKDILDIVCAAEKCVYNESCNCTADSIHVAGDKACDCRETKCATFKM